MCAFDEIEVQNVVGINNYVRISSLKAHLYNSEERDGFQFWLLLIKVGGPLYRADR